MGILRYAAREWLFGFGIVLLLSAAAVLAINKRQRDALLKRFHFQHRRASAASTPPRSISPSKNDAQPLLDSKEPLTSTTPSPDYVHAFPPTRRSVLPELSSKVNAASSKDIPLATEPSVDFLVKNALPTTRSYEFENEIPKYTSTGFSTAEIKAMGDFPPYDILSGVPLPRPYENFDPEKAIPRPYRPFRWAYHQTMCRYIYISCRMGG